MPEIAWRLDGEIVSTCNCDWGCPCQFNALPTHGNCEALVGFHIRDGHFGGLRLDGLVFSAAAKWPGALHHGNGTIQLYVDENSTPEQRAALFALASAKHGGTFFEIFAAVCPNVLEPVIAPIVFEADHERRTGAIRVQGYGESLVEPIRNPVTGEEHRARINLPNGFEYKVAEVANATRISVTSPEPMRMEHSACHAHLCEMHWSN